MGEPLKSTRSAWVLTKKPISGSTSERVRLATGVPMTTSVCPDRRPSSAAHAASNVMNSVLPWRWDSEFSPALSSASSVKDTLAPA